MNGFSNNKLLKRLLVFLWLVVMIIPAYAGIPLWTFEPLTATTISVPANGTAIVQYRVTNQSSKPHTLTMQPIQGIAQITTGLGVCDNPFVLSGKSSCILSLQIRGSQLSHLVTDGPIVCQQGSLNQCYRPNTTNNLHISPYFAVDATITVNPSALNFAAGSNGVVTVTNSVSSQVAADNVVATILNAGNISVFDTTCPPSLAIGASCDITFTASAAEGPTNISISGSNTNIATVALTITPIVPMATINVNPTTLFFAENSTGLVTVTNDAGSPTTADNIVAMIPLSSNISMQSTDCPLSLAIGASCDIIFTASAQEGPITIPIAGDNTNTVNANVTVTSQPQITLTSPIQQSRVVNVSGVALSLQITNNLASAVNANAITVSNKAACPDVSVNDTNCASVAPGASCTLQLTSSTPYVPCMITIGGSNTANNITTLIAFSYLGGYVFQESGGSGKVVINEAQNFTSSWANSSVNIAGATSLDDGVANTNAIIVNGSCTSNPNNCAAQRCRNIGAEWYLPARSEFALVSGVLCSNAGFPCNFGDFSSFFYWSSSQNAANTAWEVTITSINVTPVTKNSTAGVRCIRAFTI